MSEDSVGAIARFTKEWPMISTLAIVVFILTTGFGGLWLAEEIHPIIGLSVMFVGMMWLQYIKEVRKDVR